MSKKIKSIFDNATEKQINDFLVMLVGSGIKTQYNPSVNILIRALSKSIVFSREKEGKKITADFILKSLDLRNVVILSRSDEKPVEISGEYTRYLSQLPYFTEEDALIDDIHPNASMWHQDYVNMIMEEVFKLKDIFGWE